MTDLLSFSRPTGLTATTHGWENCAIGVFLASCGGGTVFLFFTVVIAITNGRVWKKVLPPALIVQAQLDQPQTQNHTVPERDDIFPCPAPGFLCRLPWAKPA